MLQRGQELRVVQHPEDVHPAQDRLQAERLWVCVFVGGVVGMVVVGDWWVDGRAGVVVVVAYERARAC